MNTTETIIAKFGTQQKLAEALGIRQSNVSYWAKVGNIPARWHSKIIEGAGVLGIQISASDFLNTGQAATTPTVLPAKQISKMPPLRVLKSGPLHIGTFTVPCAVLSNGKRIIFQREIVGLLTDNKKGGLSRYFQAKNLQPFVPEKFKGVALEDVILTFPYGPSIAQAFEGTDLIEICDMYLKARQAAGEGKVKLTQAQKNLAARAEIITRAFAKVGIVAAIDEASGYQKANEEYQRLLAQYIAEDLQPWIKTFGENFYYQIYRLKGWDWSRYTDDKINHPWEVAKITNRIVYEKLPAGVLEKLKELNPITEKGYRKHKNFQFLTPNLGYVHLVKHLGHVESIMEHHADLDWVHALHEIDGRFPSLRDPYGQPMLPFPSERTLPK
ncbi:MAG: P63C domain-containing protein [Verrucomicrobiia bacterium]